MAKITAKGVYKSSAPTLANGDDHDLLLDASGNLKVAVSSDVEIGAVEIKNGSSDDRMDVETAGADAKSNTANTASVIARLLGFNGTTWDRLRTGISTATTTFTGWLNVFAMGIYNATAPTLTDGQAAPKQLNNKGLLKVEVGAAYGSVYNTLSMMGNTGDAMNGAVVLATGQIVWNGVGYDRVYNNRDVTLLTSSSRTTTQTSADLVNYNGRGLYVVLDMTNVGTGSVTLAINAKDAISGKYYALLTGAVVNTNSTNVYKIYPGITVAANAAVSDALPRTFQIVVTANNANAATYSVGYSVIV